MLSEDFYEQVRKKRVTFTILSFILITFFSGISFTFVIPTLKGFDWIFVLITLTVYVVAANIFIALYKNQILVIYILSFVFSSMGMGWRIWLEWGEFSLVEHMNPVVLIGYPFVVALVIVLIYQIFARLIVIKSQV